MMLWWLFLGIREAGIHFNRFSVGCYQSHHSHIPGCNYQGLLISLQTGCAATGPTRRPQEWVWTHWEYSNPGVDQAPDEHDDVASVRSSIRLGMVAASTMRWRFTDGRQTSRTGCIFWPHLDYQRISGNPADPLWPFRVKNNDPRRRVSQQPKQPFRSSTSVSSLVLELVAALTVQGAMPTYSAAGWTTTEIAPTVLHRQRCQTVVCEAELRHSAGSDILVPVPAFSSLERVSCGHQKISGHCSHVVGLEWACIMELGYSCWDIEDSIVWVIGIGRNGAKLAYLVHRSIIFESCIILGMLIKDVMAPRAINHFWQLPYLRDVN